MNKFFIFILLLILPISFIGCGGSDSDTNSTIDKSATTKLNTSGTDGDERAEMNRKRRNNDQDQTESQEATQVKNEGSSTTNPAPTGPMKNGLFPDIPMPRKSMANNSPEFGGGLFPDFVPSAAKKVSDNSVASNSGGSSPRDDDPFDLGGEDDNEMTTSDVAATSEMSAKPISLLLDAKEKFQSHMESEAINIIYANHLVSNDSKEQYQLHWYPGLKEPRLLFRFGVGVIYNAPRDFEGRHPVIGDPGDPNEGASTSARGGRNNGGLGAPGLSGGGGRRGGSGARTYKNIDTSRPDGALLYYTGDFGEQFISFLDSRRADDQSPYFGQVLKDVMELKAPESEQDDSNDRGNTDRGRPRPASSALGIAGGGGGGRNAGRGRNGGGNNQPLERTDTSVIDRAMGQSTAERPADDFQGSIRPGVTLIGVGKKADLLELSNKAGVDALVLFNVKVSESRGSRNRRNNTGPTIFSSTSMKIVDVKTGENIFSSKNLKDTDVKEENDEGEDPVKKEIERAFKTVIDKQFKAEKLPAGLNEENVKKRVGRLLKNESSNPLAAAVEIASYHHSKLLTDELANMAMTRLFGSPDAEVLVTGTTSQRMEFLKEWLPDSIE